MRILLSAQQALRPHAVPRYEFWTYYFRQALAEAGHEVVEVPGTDWAEGLTDLAPMARAQWLGDTWSRTVDFLQAEHARQRIDLFLGYLFPAQVEPAAIATIRNLGIPCVNFFCDNVREFTRVPSSFHGFDLHWVPEAEARSLYAAGGLPYFYAPMPMWVPPALRQQPLHENSNITFIGSHDALREDLLGEAVARGLQLTVHGDGWRPGDAKPRLPAKSHGATLSNQLTFLRTHGLRGLAMRATYQLHRARASDWIDRCWRAPVQGEHYFRTTRDSQITIGINRYPSFRHPFSRPGRYSRLRDIEAPMLGACYLVEWAPGLSDLYDLETEVATYRDAAELVEKADRLQHDPVKRQSLRRLGQLRALSHHSLARSVERMMEKIGTSH